MATFIVYIRNIKMSQILYMVKNKYYLSIVYLIYLFLFFLACSMGIASFVTLYPASLYDFVKRGYFDQRGYFDRS